MNSIQERPTLPRADLAVTLGIHSEERQDVLARPGSLREAIASVETISLGEMAGAELMDRSESKFLLPTSALPTLLDDLAPHYRVLSMDGEAVLPYRSLYLDTPDFELYYAHHNGRSRRFKARFRSYVQTSTTFFEVKERKVNGRTVKTRTPESGPNLPLEGSGAELLKRVPTRDQTLEPKLWVNYQRITLVGRNRPERLTLDLNLEFQRPADPWPLSAGDVVIAELKRATQRQYSPFADYARAQRFQGGSFSKYGVGCSLLYPIRHNAFKPQRLALERLLDVV